MKQLTYKILKKIKLQNYKNNNKISKKILMQKKQN